MFILYHVAFSNEICHCPMSRPQGVINMLSSFGWSLLNILFQKRLKECNNNQ